jgi:hypothetical protein
MTHANLYDSVHKPSPLRLRKADVYMLFTLHCERIPDIVSPRYIQARTQAELYAVASEGCAHAVLLSCYRFWGRVVICQVAQVLFFSLQSIDLLAFP